MGNKYTITEMLFADRYQWVRRRARAFWVKCESGRWVKFLDDEPELIGMDPKDLFGNSSAVVAIEDWRHVRPTDWPSLFVESITYAGAAALGAGIGIWLGDQFSRLF